MKLQNTQKYTANMYILIMRFGFVQTFWEAFVNFRIKIRIQFDDFFLREIHFSIKLKTNIESKSV